MKHRASSAFVLVFFLIAGLASAQDPKKESQLRTVKGVVVDKGETPVQGSIVYLQNMRTKQVRSYVADTDGNFRFSGLDPNVDYEVYAERDGARSPTRQVSSLDNRKEIVLTLKLGKKKD